MTKEMAEHILELIRQTPMTSLLDCQILIREIKRIAELNKKS